METTELGMKNVAVERPDRVGAKAVGERLQNWVGHSLRSFHHLLTCGMATLLSGSRPRLVGRPLLYTISAFASLGVFLVSYLSSLLSAVYSFCPLSSVMIKGNAYLVY